MNNNDFAEIDVIAKFVFLALIEQRPGISDSELMNLACQTMYMDYFSFVTIKEELQNKGLAKLSVRKNEQMTNFHGKAIPRWDLTPSGEQMLITLNPTIPDAVLKFIHNFVSPLPLTSSLVAKVVSSGYGDYWAVLQVIENGRIKFEYKIIVPDEDAAKPICHKWQQQGNEIFPLLLAPFSK